jgi:hypothetical protein
LTRTGRTLVILTMAAWLATLTPALADVGPVGASAPPPVAAGEDPIRIGIGIGGEIIDVLSHDEDEGDDDEHHDGLIRRVLEILFGEEDDSAGAPATLAQPADDDEGLIGEPLDGVVEILEDVADSVTDGVDAVICALVRRIDPTTPPTPPQQPCI